MHTPMIKMTQTNDFSKELQAAKKAALEIGKLQMEFFRKPLRIIRKSPKEFVSHADMKCQALAKEMLSKEFDHVFLSEEQSMPEKNTSGTYWIIDPVDGTHNFISGIPYFGVSIGLVSNNEFVMGVIYTPFFDELFWAAKGKGAFLNGKPVKISPNTDLERSMVAYDNQFYLNKKSIERYKKLIRHTFTTRIFGSAVCDFASIVAGRIDARIWNHTKVFDFAAGVRILIEAGGKATDFQGNDITFDSKEIIASNGLVHEKLINILKDT